MILFYHRIADDDASPWTMSNEMFARQIDWLTQRFDLISLEEAQRRLQRGCHRAAVSITFDDGYAANCEQALPLLIRRNIPCTYFVCYQQMRSGQPFPHDLAANRPLLPNTAEQIRALAAAGMEIGAHTRNHIDLGRMHDPRRLRDEVVTATADLARMAGRPIRYFSFPYGQHRNLNASVFELAREAGLEACVSAYGGYNFPGGDAFHLQRIHADEDMLKLENWLTFDTRKHWKKRWMGVDAATGVDATNKGTTEHFAASAPNEERVGAAADSPEVTAR